MMMNTALVAGVSGVVGSRIAETLAASGVWRVIGLSRRVPAKPLPDVTYAAVDLVDAAESRQFAGRAHGVTHLFFAARHEFTTGSRESDDLNTAMFQNLLDALEQSNHPLHHVHLVHGTKYYGSTLGRFPTPAREDAPRIADDNFYYRQEDIVRQRRGARGWSWSASRPHGVCDNSLATPRSLPLLIATYAAICRQLGQPLYFPGTLENYRAIYQCTDARLLARAIVWMATNPACANQAFNLTNGDYFRWENMWPVFARYFGLDLGPVRTIRLAEVMPSKMEVWNAIVAAHGLVQTPYDRMALWSYGDFIFTPGWDMMSSTTKLRQYGFTEVMDSERMFIQFFDRFRRDGIIPGSA